MNRTKLLIAIPLYCSMLCCVFYSSSTVKNDTSVVVVDRKLNFVSKVYNRDSVPCIEIKGNYLETKKDNAEFARMYFCFSKKNKSIVQKYNFILKNYKVITAEELNKITHIDTLFSLFPHPAPYINIRKQKKVYLVFKEDYNNKENVKLYPVTFSANEVVSCE